MHNTLPSVYGDMSQIVEAYKIVQNRRGILGSWFCIDKEMYLEYKLGTITYGLSHNKPIFCYKECPTVFDKNSEVYLVEGVLSSIKLENMRCYLRDNQTRDNWPKDTILFNWIRLLERIK